MIQTKDSYYERKAQKRKTRIMRKKSPNHSRITATALRHLRERLLDPVIGRIPGFQYFPKEIKLRTLFLGIDFATCKYIADGMDLRNFLASKPRTYD